MLNRALDRLEEGLVAGFMAAATVIIFLAVLHRVSLNISWLWLYTRALNFTWAQELCIYLFIWMAKFGAAYGVRTGIHVGVDVLVRKLLLHQQHFLVQFSLLAMSCALSCAFFAAISGFSPDTVVAIGPIMLPAMVSQRYSRKFSVGVWAASGGMGILIPPSSW